MSPDGRFLFVANSNFDLRYNSGSLHSYNLETLSTEIATCQSEPVEEREECGVIPVEDEWDPGDLPQKIRPVPNLLADEVLIGSYADGMEISPSGGRLYLPIRSDANLTFVDVDGSGQLFCGGEANGRHICSDDYRRGVDEASTLRGIELPTDPVGIHVGAMRDLRVDDDLEYDGDYVLMAHRGGRVSLFLDEAAPETPGLPSSTAGRPRLVHTLSGLPPELVDLSVDPVTRLAWIANNGEPVISRVGVGVDPVDRERSFLFDAGGLPVRDVDTLSGSNGDTRVVRFDPRDGVRRAYILSRLPRALLTVDLDRSVQKADVVGLVPVGFGPSRLEVQTFPAAEGRPSGHTLAFISCFDSRDLYVIDVDAGRLVGIVRSLGGPFELEVDVARRRLYVLDFRSSVIRVIDLLPMFECLDDDDFIEMNVDRNDECSPLTLGVVGRPRAVRELI
ncbi:MAG: hypothetical protein KC616_26035 [Myxococcales bacterium]|nr:hypothetical protein [Myxococcales bacterium]